MNFTIYLYAKSLLNAHIRVFNLYRESSKYFVVNGGGCLKVARTSGKAQARLRKWKEEDGSPRDRAHRGSAPLGTDSHMGLGQFRDSWDLTAALSRLTGTKGTHGSVPCPEGLGTVSLPAPLPMGPVLQSRADGQGSSHLSTWISLPLRLVWCCCQG